MLCVGQLRPTPVRPASRQSAQVSEANIAAAHRPRPGPEFGAIRHCTSAVVPDRAPPPPLLSHQAARRTTAAARRRSVLPPAAFFNRGKEAGSGDGSGAQGSPKATGTANSQETLVSDGAIKSLSPEARRIFREVRNGLLPAFCTSSCSVPAGSSCMCRATSAAPSAACRQVRGSDACVGRCLLLPLMHGEGLPAAQGCMLVCRLRATSSQLNKSRSLALSCTVALLHFTAPQAQDNIIELNKSRLRALEELKAARAKIADLGALPCCPSCHQLHLHLLLV